MQLPLTVDEATQSLTVTAGNARPDLTLPCDLVEEIASLSACSPKQFRIASVSSLSLYGVEVPCALM